MDSVGSFGPLLRPVGQLSAPFNPQNSDFVINAPRPAAMRPLALIGDGFLSDRQTLPEGGFGGFINETAARGYLFRQWAPTYVRNGENSALFLFSSSVVAGIPLAQLVASYLRDRLEWEETGGRLWDIETCIHESASNALLHGVLELPPLSDLGFEAFDRLRQSRLNSPFRARRTICVFAVWTEDSLHISVENETQARAYDLQMETEPTTKQHYSGRGLKLIRSMADHVKISSDFSHIRMEFSV